MGFNRSTGRILIALILCAVTARGALSVASRATALDSASTATAAMTVPNNMAAGSTGVIFMATDNATGAGATPMYTDATVVDSKGNTWTQRVNTVYDPGANSAGIAIAVYTGTLNTALVIGDTVTFNLAASVSQKVGAFWEVSTNTGGAYVAYVNSGAKCLACTSGQTGTAVTLATGTLTSGDVVVCGVAFEGSGSPTADTDTNAGTWITQIQTWTGTGNSGTAIAGQAKLVTANGTQSYDVTITSADYNAAWVSLREATIPVTVNNGEFLPFFTP